MALIDPARDPQPYYDFATLHEASIVAVIETHPHADFISSHLEIHQTTGATIYVSKLLGALYPHETFDDGDAIELSDIKLKCINTPGHSPDSICVIITDENGKQTSIFTGDTLFVGDVGRPDLRENAGNITSQKEELAKQLYHSTRDKLMKLPAEMTVYPAHGPGSLCGKHMSPDLDSTIGKELRNNYALQAMEETQFISLLTSDQPFMPRYFGFDVEMNKQGAPAFQDSIDAVPVILHKNKLKKNLPVIDTRPAATFKQGHMKGAINLQDGGKFETWLGSIINPDESFYLIAENVEGLDIVIRKAAKIGYEKNIEAALLVPEAATDKTAALDLSYFKKHLDQYTIVDVRNWTEINDGKLFENALTIPLPELRERLSEIPTDKPIVVHCAAGYRSAAASSILAGAIDGVLIYDLGEAVEEFMI